MWAVLVCMLALYAASGAPSPSHYEDALGKSKLLERIRALCKQGVAGSIWSTLDSR
jgi:hypothetical protein